MEIDSYLKVVLLMDINTLFDLFIHICKSSINFGDGIPHNFC